MAGMINSVNAVRRQNRHSTGGLAGDILLVYPHFITCQVIEVSTAKCQILVESGGKIRYSNCNI